MCGIVGAFDLSGRREFPREIIAQMTGAIVHRGPDDEQFHLEPGLAFGVRRLSVIDVAGGQQPISNESGDIWVAFEGELYEYPSLRKQLLARGHNLATSCDTEAWVHLYEDFGEDVVRQANGQFAVSLWDRSQRTLLIARDRAGISPLFYTIQDNWLLWASEIKALLASGMIEARPDVRGLDYFFNFFCIPTERTCFEGIHQLPPGHLLRVRGSDLQVSQYWDLDFPDRGAERQFKSLDNAAEELEELLRAAIRRRLVGEVPLSCYISGGLDSTVILGLSCQERGEPIPSFTIGLDGAGPRDERLQAEESARLIGSDITTVNVTEADIGNAFPRLIEANEGPVMDTSAACMILLADANRRAGRIVALTGEGADEALAGYTWFKWHRLQMFTDKLGSPLDSTIQRGANGWLIGGGRSHRPPLRATQGLRLAQQITWEFMAQSRERLFSEGMWQRLDSYSAYDELPLTSERMKRWHPLNQSLYAAFKVMMPGLLLQAKGDRAARCSSTEGRYPFLDENVIAFCSQLPTNYKLKGCTDKRLLRAVASRVLPQTIARRPKTMFRANMGKVFLGPNRPTWIDELLSPESLRATGYFDPRGVQFARDIQFQKGRKSLRRFSMDMGLAGVVSTQLWHHLFCGGGLASLPTWSPPAQAHTTAIP